MDIEEWIEQQRQQGHTDAEIRSQLESAGWDSARIDQLLGTGQETATASAEEDSGRSLPVSPRLLGGGVVVVALIVAGMLFGPGLLDGGSGLVTHYSFDQSSEQEITPATGSGPTFPIGPGMSYVDGVSGDAIKMAGQQVQGRGSLISTNTGEMTVSMWVNPADRINTTDPDWLQIPSLFTQRFSSAQILFIRGGLIGIGPGAAAANTGTLPQGPATTIGLINTQMKDEWTHVAVTYADGTLRLYVGGYLRAQSANSELAGISPNTPTWLLGDDGFNGAIDELRIYDQALSADRVQSLYLKNAPDR